MPGMRILKAALWLIFVIVLVCLVYGTAIVRRGFSTKDQPSALETAIARGARSISIPSDAKEHKNPYPATPKNLEDGMEHFADHCATCHGNDGSGHTLIGLNLYPKPPDMRLAETQNLTDGELFYIISNGVRMTGMPGWATSHKPEETWGLVDFIRHLPQMTDQEKKDMEKFNPKSIDGDNDDKAEPQ
jgi:mono/diheme cytochrome c family protein